MAMAMAAIPFLFLIFCFKLYPSIAQTKNNNLQTYIVHVSQPEGRIFSESGDLENWHKLFLTFTTATSEEQPQRMLYSYQNIISGFAARLTQEDVKAMEKMDGFVSARPERKIRKQTTHSPNFLGLHQNFGLWQDSNLGKGMIIGVLDGGVAPDHPSFSDKGMPPPPAKWKGRCDFAASECNNKLIGARSFNLAAKAVKGAMPERPTDVDGHGTHTASTAAGNFVYGANVLGSAQGTAVGMAPYAHLAIYKVCFGDPDDDCPESDILAGMDTAIQDGVDVLSLSLGGKSMPFFEDNIAIGAFAATQKGIFVSCSAGNLGPFHSTLSNEAPWILTVGASTIDRKIVATAKLGNGAEFDGESVFQPSNFPATLLPLVYAGINKPESAFCGEGTLSAMDVKGKVVLCERGGEIGRVAKGAVVKSAGGVAMIIANDQANGFSTIADTHILPATHVSFDAGEKIKAYIRSTKRPMATILFKGTVIGDSLSPAVTSFSSRGPNLASPGILKPDIIGPGVSILAAWFEPIDNNTHSKANFNIMSGTSMPCPHLSGIAALLKSAHPYWSPAAIKSAMMTTADILNTGRKPIIDETNAIADVFATGSGHVNPARANDPGLIYDIQPDDYVPYLCGLGYTDKQISIIAHKTITCSGKPKIPEGQLNYPSFSVTLGPSQTFTRTVTNVGSANSVYMVTVVSPPGVVVDVKPDRLYFSKVNQKATYSVTFNRSGYGGRTVRNYCLYLPYIVHVSKPEGRTFSNSEDLQNWHSSFLTFSTASSDEEPRQRLLYSFKSVISGFSARLTEKEVNAMKKMGGFVSAHPERKLRKQTTRTPNFLGLHQQFGVWKSSNLGKGIIIGVLDTGVLPRHPSFNDKGMPPPPAKWKGRCDFTASECNNKLIGARTFNLAAKVVKGATVEPPIDVDGHGTHTASIAAGNFVYGAEVLGNAEGTSAGMAPYSHLAIYKVCFGYLKNDCPESDIIAGMDAAIQDGVDVLSISLVGESMPFFQDNIAIGSYAAIQKGIFVSCSAGNEGPFNSSLSNEAPWILTVGASTIDRKIVATAKLGNGEELEGESVFQPSNFPSTLLPLVYAGMNRSESAFCGQGSLSGIDVKGKVVFYERGEIDRLYKGAIVKSAGGAAMILANDQSNGFSIIADPHVLPATHVSFAAGQKIKAYISSTKTPKAAILFKGTVIGDSLSPAISSFSSRGPNLASPGILKPDIIGPGVSILAAWHTPLDNSTNSKANFNIMSGTSMSCPHLSGIAALLKSAHPSWSPAAIKSAMMTTADILNTGQKPIVDETDKAADVFATGSGHVNPSRANDPGLISDIQPDDYVPYLCGLGYTDKQISKIAHKTITCSRKPRIPEGQLNYPSFSVALGPSQTFTRTLTNVGSANSVYVATVVPPAGVVVNVKPARLHFSKVNQKATYSVTFSPSSYGGKTSEFAQGYITWVSAKYFVRSPISVKFK